MPGLNRKRKGKSGCIPGLKTRTGRLGGPTWLGSGRVHAARSLAGWLGQQLGEKADSGSCGSLERAGLGSWAESGPASLPPLLAHTTAGAATARLPSTATALRRLTGFSSLGGSGFLVLDGSGGGDVDGGLGAKGILIRATMASRQHDRDEVPCRLRSFGQRSPTGAHTRAAAQGQNGARPQGKKATTARVARAETRGTQG